MKHIFPSHFLVMKRGKKQKKNPKNFPHLSPLCLGKREQLAFISSNRRLFLMQTSVNFCLSFGNEPESSRSETAFSRWCHFVSELSKT